MVLFVIFETGSCPVPKLVLQLMIPVLLGIEHEMAECSGVDDR